MGDELVLPHIWGANIIQERELARLERAILRHQFSQSLLGTLGQQLGIRMEERFYAIMYARRNRWPRFLQTLWAGTRDQDRFLKADFVASTRFGYVYLQIKASETGEQTFNGKHKGHLPTTIMHLCIVVSPNETDEKIFDTTVEKLIDVEKHRQTPKPP